VGSIAESLRLEEDSVLAHSFHLASRWHSARGNGPNADVSLTSVVAREAV